MIVLTPELRAKLRDNARAAREAGFEDRSFDPAPVVKLFSPVSAATWLATELYDDGDTLFGLADLGFGGPEMGVFSLDEITSVRLPFGLRIERHRQFSTPFRLSVWADWSRRSGSILLAESMLARVAQGHAGLDLLPPGKGPRGG